MSDVELTLVVRAANLPQLRERVECDAFRLVEQPDGRWAIAVEHDGLGGFAVEPVAEFPGTLDDLPAVRP